MKLTVDLIKSYLLDPTTHNHFIPVRIIDEIIYVICLAKGRPIMIYCDDRKSGHYELLYSEVKKYHDEVYCIKDRINKFIADESNR